jgi:hypothetical protein
VRLLHCSKRVDQVDKLDLVRSLENPRVQHTHLLEVLELPLTVPSSCVEVQHEVWRR